MLRQRQVLVGTTVVAALPPDSAALCSCSPCPALFSTSPSARCPLSAFYLRDSRRSGLGTLRYVPVGCTAQLSPVGTLAGLAAWRWLPVLCLSRLRAAGILIQLDSAPFGEPVSQHGGCQPRVSLRQGGILATPASGGGVAPHPRVIGPTTTSSGVTRRCSAWGRPISQVW